MTRANGDFNGRVQAGIGRIVHLGSPHLTAAMVSVELAFRRTRLIKAYHRWFAKEPLRGDRLRFAYYYHCASTEEWTGFVRERKYTKLLDITPDEDQIVSAFSKTSRYEVRRARKEEMEFGMVEQMDKFLKFYNQFAAAKNLPEMDEMILSSYWPHMRVTSMGREGEVFVMHAYVVDGAASRVNLIHSASGFRGMYDKELRRLYGRGNRLLHMEDILWFKQEGFRCYDFGGYAFQTGDKSLAAVNEFKDSFGGELIEESNYTSIALSKLRQTKKWLAKRRP